MIFMLWAFPSVRLSASTVNLDEYVKLVEESNQKAVSRLYDVLRLYPKKG